MAAFLGSSIPGEVGLRLLLSPLGSLSPLSSNIVIRASCCSVGIALPVYSTYKAIESKDHDEQKRWLIYWAAFGSFTLVEVFTDKLISWCPMYYHVKFAFLVWLLLPSTEGAKQLYMNHLRPFFQKHQARADQITGMAYSELAKLVSKHQTVVHFARTHAGTVISSVQQLMRGEISAPAPGLRRITEGEATGQETIEGDSKPLPETESDKDD
uniref:HVA22-like protein n=1 Tax=Kalanchoe fedtschenkoi TaxID=63787 RepID=A0A7N0T851_KALFE